jgi:hypothetical protein
MYGIPFLVSLATFCATDSMLTRLGFQGVYYAIHTLHNAAVVQATYNEVLATFTDFKAIGAVTPNYYAAELVFALHIYHCLYYWRKFRTDDWLHHILMIGVALPIGICVPSGTLLGFSLFFTTGLPGGIDYALLFLTRNNWLHKETEKRVNAFLATWLRAPGCVAQAALTLAFLSTQNMQDSGPYIYWLAYLTAALNYWNGMYFGAQVLYDAGVRQVRGSRVLLA